MDPSCWERGESGSRLESVESGPTLLLYFRGSFSTIRVDVVRAKCVLDWIPWTGNGMVKQRRGSCLNVLSLRDANVGYMYVSSWKRLSDLHQCHIPISWQISFLLAQCMRKVIKCELNFLKVSVFIRMFSKFPSNNVPKSTKFSKSSEWKIDGAPI